MDSPFASENGLHHLSTEAWLRSPVVAGLHGALLLALLFHTLTWLHLAPRAMVVRLGGRRVPDTVVLAGHYAAWLGASAFVAWALLA